MAKKSKSSKSFPTGAGKLRALEKVSIFGYVRSSGKSGYQIRFRANTGDSNGTQNKKITISHQTYETWLRTLSMATEINSSLLLGTYDNTKWFPEKVKTDNKNGILNLKIIWDNYKNTRKNVIAEKTQNDSWKRIDKILNISDCFDITENNLKHLMDDIWIKTYSYNTLFRCLSELNTALHLYPEFKRINVKEYLKPYKHLKRFANRSHRVFSESEINTIIHSFQNDLLYQSFIKLMCLTGARPGELLNLTTEDIKSDTQLRIYATKTKKERYFPINIQLNNLLRTLWTDCQFDNNKYLLHTKNGNKIDLHNFSNRIWKPTVTKLVKEGKVKEYLPLYNLRHTWITRMLNTEMEGVTVEQKIKNIAYLAGTSQKMIFEHYQGLSQKLEIPEIAL